MASLSLPQPPPAFQCAICEKPENALKAGPACEACPAYRGSHYFPSGEGSNTADLVIVGDVPTAPRVFLVGGKATPGFDTQHYSFKEDGGKVLKNAVQEVQKRNAAFKFLTTRYVYGVKCAVDSPSKAVITACSTPLKVELNRIAATRRATNPESTLTVLACGVHALHSLGIPVKGEKEALGRVYQNVQFGDAILTVIFTRSIKAIGAAVGKYSSLLADVERAMRLATNSEVLRMPRTEVEKNYIYPKTIEEVRAVVRRIYEYTRPGVSHLDWKITCDTETNTLHPHWDGLQLVAVSFAWDEGQATTIPLWHKETPYDPQAAYEEVCWLLRSGKPIIWFNAKYDFKVFWKKGWPLGDVGKIAWDVYLAEHTLEEDKKGLYSLKYMTKQDFPELSGYEDRLHDELEKQDTTGLTTVEVKVGKVMKLPPAVAEALERAVKGKYVKNASFQLAALEKKIAKLAADPEKASDWADLRVLAHAKKSGEFSGKAEKEAKREQEIKGGFENVSLSEMYFYAAVDADVTRRAAVRQAIRMAEENDRINLWREQIRKEIATAIPGSEIAGRRVEVLCPNPNPLKYLVQEHGVKLQTELAKIEYQGITIDQKYREWGARALETTVGTTTQKVYELCGESFNVNSGRKLVSYLFEDGYKHPDPELAAQIAEENPKTVFYRGGRMFYRPGHYTAKGAVQTGSDVLKHLVQRYKCPLANLLMSLKKADKALNSFFVNIGKLSTMWGDGRLHPGYNITGTSTSRLSSSSGIRGIGFNNQNIPKGLIGALKNSYGELIRNSAGDIVFEGVKCKNLFIPDDPSMCFGNADAKGAEVTVFAGYSGDDALNAALIEGLDAHCFFASRCLNPDLVAAGLTGVDRKLALAKAGIDDDHAWSYEDFYLGKDDKLADKAYGKRLKALRDNIKRLVFGILYGAGIKKIADIAGINLELAEQIQKLLFSEFPTIPTFVEHTTWEMGMFGLVESYTGRRRRFSLGKYAPKSLKSRSERQAVNFMIQETSSTIVLRVLYKIARILEHDYKGRLLLTVHDSIGFQVPRRYAHEMVDLFQQVGTKEVAKENPWLKAPYRWDVELGESYGSVVGAEKFCQGLPPPEPRAELEGFTEEEVFDALRDPDSHDMPEKTKGTTP